MTTSSGKSRYIDSSGNEISRSTYESLLAHDILTHPEYWQDVYDKFTKKIVAIIDYNKSNDEFNAQLQRTVRIVAGTFPQINSVEKLVSMLSGKEEFKEDYPNQLKFGVYKYFIERAIGSAWILPLSHLFQENKEINTKETYYQYTERAAQDWRPSHFFRSDEIRGRLPNPNLNPDEKLTRHAGITSEAGTHAKLKDKFANQPIEPAKKAFTRNPKSTVAQTMEKHDLPFSAGPSGTIGFIMSTFNALLGPELTPDDNKKIVMALGAQLVLEGHHGWGELGLVIQAKGKPFEIDLSLPAKDFYKQFLAQEYLFSDAFHKFSTEYHPSKYSAMTWEILRDAVFEDSKNSKNKFTTPQATFMTQLKDFCLKNQDKNGELTPEDLEKVKTMLQAGTDKQRSMPVVSKIIKKLEDAGIPIQLTAEIKVEEKPKVVEQKVTPPSIQTPVEPQQKISPPTDPISQIYKRISVDEGHAHLKKICGDKDFVWLIREGSANGLLSLDINYKDLNGSRGIMSVRFGLLATGWRGVGGDEVNQVIPKLVKLTPENIREKIQELTNYLTTLDVGQAASIPNLKGKKLFTTTNLAIPSADMRATSVIPAAIAIQETKQQSPKPTLGTSTTPISLVEMTNELVTNLRKNAATERLILSLQDPKDLPADKLAIRAELERRRDIYDKAANVLVECSKSQDFTAAEKLLLEVSKFSTPVTTTLINQLQRQITERLQVQAPAATTSSSTITQASIHPSTAAAPGTLFGAHQPTERKPTATPELLNAIESLLEALKPKLSVGQRVVRENPGRRVLAPEVSVYVDHYKKLVPLFEKSISLLEEVKKSKQIPDDLVSSLSNSRKMILGDKASMHIDNFFDELKKIGIEVKLTEAPKPR